MTGLHLVLQGVVKRFGAVPVLDGVDLDLASGARGWLSGANGAGKSTLLDLITGAQRADAGRMQADAVVLDRLTMPARARLGIVRGWQLPCVFGSHTVGAQLAAAIQLRAVPVQGRGAVPVALSLRPAALDAHDEAVNALAARWGLADKRDALPAALSHAQRRLLDLALAFAGPARLVLLDEPSAGLSRRDADELFALLDEQTRGCTVLIVEHDHRLARSYAERSFTLREGRLHAEA